MLGSGFLYRSLSAKFAWTPVYFKSAISAYPIIVNGWHGEDVAIPDSILRVTGNDDYIFRHYVYQDHKRAVDLYIAFSNRPSTMLGHRPDICYVAGGWILDTMQPYAFTTAMGTSMTSLIHQFHKPHPENMDQYVLNYYILNGQVVSDEKGFTGLSWRRPNISGKLAQYVAQVQISSQSEADVQVAAAELSDMILACFEQDADKSGILPDEAAYKERLE
jgi:hypothetical protein